MTRNLRLVPPAERAGTWRIAADESVVELVIDGAVACTVAPWTHDKSGELAWWAAQANERVVALDEGFAEVCRCAALVLGVVAPLPADLLAELGERPAAADPDPASLEPLLERFADVLSAILDEPLATLASAGPDGGRDPLQLRLAHYRPDLAERAAELLDEVGR